MDLRDLRFGVEIETVGKPREMVAQAIASVVGGEPRHVGQPATFDPWEVTDSKDRIWKVVSDASLTSVPEFIRAEVVTPILGYEDIEEFQAVVRAVRATGAKADSTCGLHIHVDASAFDGRKLANFAKLVYKQEAIIIRALCIQERRLEKFTKPISPEFIGRLDRQRPRTLDQLNRAWYGRHKEYTQHYDSSRYCIVNLASVFYRGTIEVRAFEATLHAGKVKAYVQFVLAIAAKAWNNRAAASRKRPFDPVSARYDLRVFLLRLGMIGSEFKAARKHLLAALPGDSAFKRGRPTTAAKGEATKTSTETEDSASSVPLTPDDPVGFELVAVLNAAEAAGATEAGIDTRPLASSGEPTAAEEGAAETGGAE